MGGFAAGLSQGLEQARDRQIQAQQLQLQQDYAKAQQKAMESEDQLRQLNMQSLLKKMAFQEGMGGRMNDITGSPSLGPGVEGPQPEPPVTIDRRKIASFLQEAANNGQDPQQLLTFMEMMDPTGQIGQIRQDMQPAETKILPEGSTLVQVGGRQARQPQAQPQAPAPAQPQQPSLPPLDDKTYQANLERGQALDMAQQTAAGDQPIDFIGLSERLPPPADFGTGGIKPPTPQAPAAPSAPQQPPGPNVRVLAEGKPKATKETQPFNVPEGTKVFDPVTKQQIFENPKEAQPKAINATEAAIVGVFADTFKDKMAMVQQSLGHVPNLQEISQYFTSSEFAVVMRAVEQREKQNRIEVAKATGLDAADRAAKAKINEPVMEEAASWFRYNPDTGLIDQLTDPMLSKEKATQGGYRKIPEGRTDRIQRFNDIEFDLKQRISRLKNVADAIVTSSGGLSAWQQGASLNFDSLLRSGMPTTLKDENTGKTLTVGEAVSLYNSLIDTIREPYARNVNGLKGPATERDIASAGKAFTALTETKAISARKFQEIDDRLEDVKRSAVADLFGGQMVTRKKAAGTKGKPPTGAEADTDFLSTLTPTAKERYLKMSPDQQSRYKRAYLDQLNKAVVGATP